MLQKTNAKNHRKIIHDTFKSINDLVVPTMGARGRLAVIKEEFEIPTLTDDGVTVAKQARYYDDFQQMVAASMIEAAANTEKEAYDGTTLTILMTYQFYKAGLRLLKPRFLGGKGLHPQQAADELERIAANLQEDIQAVSWKPQGQDILSIAEISTKIPKLASVVYDAYKIAGDGMNVIVEHNRENPGFHVVHEKGLTLDSGFMGEVMRNFCNEEGRTEFKDATIALFKEGFMTQTMLMNFFSSIPEDKMTSPFVFVVTPDFNPETLKLLLSTLVNNGFIFQFVFITEERAEELFLDIAAVSRGKIQDMNLATSEYTFADCGHVPSIIINETTTIIQHDNPIGLDERKDFYQRKLNAKYKLSINQEKSYMRRLSSLTSGLVKIQIGVATVTEYKILQLKLDDAIGAVRKSIEHGAVLGGGKALYNLAEIYPSYYTELLQAPALTIARNAGYKLNHVAMSCNPNMGLNVSTGEIMNLKKAGIIDSRASIHYAIAHASSIAASYLRSYILIQRKNPTK